MIGEPALINGEIASPLRTEAQARADRKFRTGERFEQAERRWFCEARQRFDMAIEAAVTAMTDANLGADQIQIFRDHVADAVGDTWAADYRARDEQ